MRQRGENNDFRGNLSQLLPLRLFLDTTCVNEVVSGQTPSSYSVGTSHEPLTHIHCDLAMLLESQLCEGTVFYRQLTLLCAVSK